LLKDEDADGPDDADADTDHDSHVIDSFSEERDERDEL